MSSKVYTLITGASRGIGVSFAQQLAAKGHNLILVARSENVLKTLQGEISAKYPAIEVHILAKDLGAPNAPQEVFEQTKQWPVSLLINNAGFGHEVGVAIVNQSVPGLEQMMHINMIVLTVMCRLYLPGIRAIARERPSLTTGIINIASLFAFQPTPYISAYGATKAYVANFTEAIAYEAAHAKDYLPNVHIIAVSPGPVATEFWDNAGAKSSDMAISAVTPDRVAKEGIAHWEKSADPRWIVKWSVVLLVYATALLPKSLSAKIWADGTGGERLPEKKID